jgi:peptidoglycan/xylan/chitin deacetylase (PgdA/CDA1 family)
MQNPRARPNRGVHLTLVVALLVSTLLAAIATPSTAGAATIRGITVKGFVNASDGLNLRTRASWNAPVIMMLAQGKRMVILGTSGEWFKVSVSGKTGYVHSTYITLVGRSSKVIVRGNTSRKMVALTFDAGSDLGFTEQIITTLEDYGVIASFGLTGAWMKQNHAYADWIVAHGHQIINHSFTHPSFTGNSTNTAPISPAQRVAQLVDNEGRLHNLTDAVSRPYWRPPYGDYDAGVLRDVSAIGYGYTVMWSLDSLGWNGYSADQIYQRVVNNVGNGSIVLLHLGSASQDAAALERIIQTLRSRGYSFGTVADVIA